MLIASMILSTFVGVPVGPQLVNEVAVGLQQRGYIQPQYAADAVEGEYLHLVGEGVPFCLQFKNLSEGPIALQAPAGVFDAMVQMAVYRKESGTWQQVQTAISYSPNITHMSRFSSFVEPWREPYELLPGNMLSVDAMLNITEPGVYQLRVQSMPGSCGPKCTLVDRTGLLRFEVRGLSGLSEQLEVLIRGARNATLDSRYEEADQLLAQMLRLHPDSVIARLMAADNGEGKGDLKAAEAHYRTAVSLIRSGRDTLFARGKTTDDLRSLAAGVEERIARLTLRQPR